MGNPSGSLRRTYSDRSEPDRPAHEASLKSAGPQFYIAVIDANHMRNGTSPAVEVFKISHRHDLKQSRPAKKISAEAVDKTPT